PRRRSWALTGTPVENSVDDLLGIFEFLAPGYLSANMPLRGLGKAAGEYILRRTKQQVLTDLPPKLVHDAHLELGPAQRAAYELAESKGTIRLSELGPKMTIQHVFELVLRLKQICNFEPTTGESAKLDRLVSDMEEIVASGQKAIVFSQWVETIARIRKATRDFGPLEFHGRISASQREVTLRRFREDRHAHLLLMSYGAGSVGLNLQFASYVFLFDRWWNPAVEDQAINRAHRIGASGPVTVTRFLSLHTIEERINDILEQKRELFETILSHAGQPQRMGLSQREILSLFPIAPQATTDAAA
ncbi:MAG TPA: DEAD/DEAH box helicase, partial [Pirellulaceae bacterium]